MIVLMISSKPYHTEESCIICLITISFFEGTQLINMY